MLMAVWGGVRVYGHMANSKMSALLMENIDALTADEVGSVCYQNMGHCSNAKKIVNMCTKEETGERCWVWVKDCKFC